MSHTVTITVHKVSDEDLREAIQPGQNVSLVRHVFYWLAKRGYKMSVQHEADPA